MFFWFGGVFAAGPRPVETGAILCFDLRMLMLRYFIPKVDGILIASILFGFLSDEGNTDLDPE